MRQISECPNCHVRHMGECHEPVFRKESGELYTVTDSMVINTLRSAANMRRLGISKGDISSAATELERKVFAAWAEYQRTIDGQV